MKIERVLNAINHRQPDRVPRGELLISPAFIDKLCPEEGSLFERKKTALEKMTMDFVTVSPTPPSVTTSADGRSFDYLGRQVVLTHDHWITVEPPIKSLAEAYGYSFPRSEVFTFNEMEEWVTKTDFFVFALLDGIFQGVASLMDFNEFLIATVKKQEELRVLIDAYEDYLYGLACRCLDLGVHGLIIGDDMAASKGPLISPKALEKIFFPAYKRFLSRLRERHKPVILHCDGNINSLLPYLAGLGFAGVHSLEPAAGMDLAQVKEQYGRELCLMGNLDPALLEQGDVEAVKKAVRDILGIGSPGGGFMLSTASGSITPGMSVEAVLAMYLA